VELVELLRGDDFDVDLAGELSFLVGVRWSRGEDDRGHLSGVVLELTVDGVDFIDALVVEGTRNADTARAVVGTVLFSTKFTGEGLLLAKESGTHNLEDGATRFLVPVCCGLPVLLGLMFSSRQARGRRGDVLTADFTES